MTQAARGTGGGRDYAERLTAVGKTRTEAVRLLHRRISDRVYRALHADAACTTGSGEAATRVPSAPDQASSLAA